MGILIGSLSPHLRLVAATPLYRGCHSTMQVLTLMNVADSADAAAATAFYCHVERLGAYRLSHNDLNENVDVRSAILCSTALAFSYSRGHLPLRDVSRSNRYSFPSQPGNSPRNVFQCTADSSAYGPLKFLPTVFFQQSMLFSNFSLLFFSCHTIAIQSHSRPRRAHRYRVLLHTELSSAISDSLPSSLLPKTTHEDIKTVISRSKVIPRPRN